MLHFCHWQIIKPKSLGAEGTTCSNLVFAYPCRDSSRLIVPRQVLRLLCSDKTRLGNQIHVHNHFSFIRYMHLALLTICKIKHTSCYVPGSSAFPTIESGIHHPRKTLQIQIIHCIALQASVGIAVALQTRHFIMLPADLLLKILQASASWYSTWLFLLLCSLKK
jgi:hypothetical protein